MTTHSTRRTFLGRAVALGAATTLAPFTLPGCVLPGRAAGRGRLRHACIGVGGMGAYDMKEIGSHPDVDVVALCDVDRTLLDEAAKSFPGARLYTDWRAMLEAEAGGLDAVNVTTPDHMHAPIAMNAMHADLHVYCQKPLTHTVVEARRLTETARDRRLVTQMGIQNHSGINFRRALRIFQDGVTGPVHEVHVWTDRPAGWWPQNVERTEGSDPVPEHLDWDGWLGVAPHRPYKESAYHTFAWRGRKDFGTGAQGDMGCHLMDPVPWFLDLGHPTSIRSTGPAPNAESFPDWSEVHYAFPAGNDLCARDGVHVVWNDGGRKPDAVLAEWGAGDEVYANAALLIGTEAALLASPYEDCRLLTRSGERELTLPELPEVNHWHQWVDACLGRGEATAPFSFSGPLTEIALLGNVALHYPDEALAWDADRMTFPERADADAHLHKPYREGWSVEGLSTQRA